MAHQEQPDRGVDRGEQPPDLVARLIGKRLVGSDQRRQDAHEDAERGYDEHGLGRFGDSSHPRLEIATRYGSRGLTEVPAHRHILIPHRGASSMVALVGGTPSQISTSSTYCQAGVWPLV